jgi:Uma2 family endonuclease
MSTTPKQLFMTMQEYLHAEEISKIRHEFLDGLVFAMSGATVAHSVICMNLVQLLGSHLKGTGCNVFANDLKLKISAINSVYYPDVMVTCEPLVGNSAFIESPAVIFEVLSPSTKSVDRREKLFSYRRIASLQEYVIVYQDRMLVELYRRNSDNRWGVVTLTASDQLFLSVAGGEFIVSVSSLYEGLSIDPSNMVKEEDSEYSVV